MTALSSQSAPAGHAGLGWVDAATAAARRLAAITAAGVVLGVLVGGVGGRLAMMLLAATNPGMGGLTSDDGFMIGRFTLLGSLNLLLANAWLGIGLFMLIPGVYAVLLMLLAERWLAPDGFLARRPLWGALLPLVALVPLAPVAVALALAWLALEAVRRRHGGTVPGAAVAAWWWRACLAALFVVALVRLVDESRWLVA